MGPEDQPDSTPKRPREVALVAALDAIWREAEIALAQLQDDSKMSGPLDKARILRAAYHIEMRVKEIRELLRASGTYSSVDPHEDDSEG